jgi:ribonucleotide monophosphatase NagD (HAD superfamily)
MNLYIDIDGVLLNDALDNAGTPANHATEFLKFVTEKHNCYWLTTHCHGGENRAPEYLLQRFPASMKEVLDKIKPTD